MKPVVKSERQAKRQVGTCLGYKRPHTSILGHKELMCPVPLLAFPPMRGDKGQNWGLSKGPRRGWCLGPPHTRASLGRLCANTAGPAVAHGDPHSSPAVSLCFGADTWGPAGSTMGAWFRNDRAVCLVTQSASDVWLLLLSRL